MSELRYFYEPILKSFDFRGRSTRTQYWTWLGITAVYYFALGQVFWTPYTSFRIWADQYIWTDQQSNSAIGGLLSVAEILMLAVCWLGPVAPTLAITRRRFIDANAKLWVYKYFLISFSVCLVSVPIGLVTFWFLSLVALSTLAVFGVACLIVGTFPSQAVPSKSRPPLLP